MNTTSRPDVIYDIGANNGDDLPYYLQKARKVVAVEANPALADFISARFSKEIHSGSLVVENVAVTEFPNDAVVGFYIHKGNHVLSTTVQPAPGEIADFNYSEVPTTTIQALIATHGEPLYVKLDIEGLDAQVLRSLLAVDLRPPFISAEGHDPRILGLLSGMGGYTKFKLVEGSKVARDYKNLPFIDWEGNAASHSFPWHSAGPFGDDIPGPWLNSRDMFNLLRVRGLGWYDIHACIGEEPKSQPLSIPLGKSARAILEFSHPELLARYGYYRRKVRRAGRYLLRPFIKSRHKG